MWLEYLDAEVNGFHREDYYMAQIAAEVRRGHVKNPKKVKVEDMVLKFTTNEKCKQKKQKKSNILASKNFWLTSLGLENEHGR